MKPSNTSISSEQEVASIVQASADMLPPQEAVLARARQFAAPLLATHTLETGENALAHADGVAQIVANMGAAVSLQAMAYLIYTADHLSKPLETIGHVFTEEYAELAIQSRRLMRLQQSQRGYHEEQTLSPEAHQEQIESVRKMLLAFSRDMRVILLRLASRLQTLRHYAASKLPVPYSLAYESLHVLAPLANRLGI